MYDGSNSGMNPSTSGGYPPPSPPPPAPLPPLPSPPDFNGGYNPGPSTGNAMKADYWFKQHWILLVLIVFALLVLGETIFQIVYPSYQLIPGTKLDGVNIGGLSKQDAAKKLDGVYSNLKLAIYFGKNGAAFQSPTMGEVGIGVDNNARVEAVSYPFYLRMIPGSIWWASALEKPGGIAYTYDKNKIADYTTSKVGTDCSIPAQNATLKLVDSQLQLVPSESGGNCDITQFQQMLAEVKPDVHADNTVRIAIDETPAPVTDDMARELAGMLNSRMASPMPITVDSSTDSIPGRVVLGWLDFKAIVPEQTIDNTGNQQASLKFSVNQQRMEDYLNLGIAKRLIVKPGVSHVSTLDFTETSRVNGANGRALDILKASQSVVDYLNSKTQQAVGATVVVGPSTVYTRKYSPTSVGFSAFLAQYAQDNPGTWGLAFTELSGVRHLRTASYNGDAKMKAAGIHALYLAYTYVIQDYNGIARPVDIISGGTTATDCFKLMLQRNDKGCTDGFYDKFGYATLAVQGQNIGLTNTVFAGDDTLTSANDLQKTMVGLYKSQLARVEGGSSILSAMRGSWSNEGIPAGASVNEITHLIGESDTVHNDTAIVYDTNYGAYALTVLSDGSSWDKIANLAAKLHQLKTVKEPTNAY